jgi:hypothetical protein
MARIRYLVNNDPVLSMRMAILSENIMYGRFYRKFVELWGRLSTHSYGETFDQSSAVHSVDGIDVYGNQKVYLFKDGGVDYEYTKRICELIGADYEELYSNRGDVDDFYIYLGSAVETDFSDESNVSAAMSGVQSDLEALSINRIKLTWVLDTEYEPDATDALTLSELRAMSTAHVNYNTGEFNVTAEDLGLKPILECYGLPTLTSPDGDPVVIEDETLETMLTLFLQFTDTFDAMFDTVTLTETTLPDRTPDIYNTYHQYQYTIEFDFGSTIDVEGNVTDMIDWSHLSTIAFAETVTSKYEEFNTFFEENTRCATSSKMQAGAKKYCFLINPAQNYIVAYSAIVSFLNEFGPAGELFYKKGTYAYFGILGKTYIRADQLGVIIPRHFCEAVIAVINIDYDAKENDGWLGGSFLGEILEAVFIITTFVLSVVVSVLIGNPLPLVIGASLLYVVAAYGGMSSSAAKAALGSANLLMVGAAAYGIYDIYTIAYGVAESEAAAEAASVALANGAGEEAAADAGLAAMQNITAIDVVEALGITGTAQIVGGVYKAFNLIFPPQIPSLGEEGDTADATESDNTAIYNVNTPYDFYDDVYSIYDQ